MKHEELARTLALKSHLSLDQAKMALKVLPGIIEDELERTGEFSLLRLGTFKAMKYITTTARNIRTGKIMPPVKCRRVTFKTAKSFLKKEVDNDAS